MSDNKLTDEEIIKRLERCVNRGNRNYDTDIVLDLINRQKSEIERLKSANDEKFRQWDMLAEKTKQHYADLYEEAKDILKAEAYKECIEKVRKLAVGMHPCSDELRVFDSDLDNIIKEIEGDNDESR